MPTTLKIDVDIPQLKKDIILLQKFIDTRALMLTSYGYDVAKISWKETEKGYHFWIIIKQDLTDKLICDLQFLLGDDQARCRFNYLRLEAGCFKQFNVLFNKKLKNKH